MSVGFVILSIVFSLLAVLGMFGLVIGSMVLLVTLVRRVFRVNEDTRPHAPPEPVLCSAAGAREPGRVAKVAAAAPVSEAAASSAVAVASWRYQQLLELEVDPLTAVGAAMAGVDATSVRALVELGCPPDLAVSILAPDDQREQRLG